VETVELQVGLQNYSWTEDKRFVSVFQLRHCPRPASAALSLCVIGDERRCAEAEALGLPWHSLDTLRELQRQKKAGVKKLLDSYDAALAPVSVVRRLPRILGPSIGKVSKFPTALAEEESLMEAVEALRRKTKWQLRKSLGLNVAVGHVQMTPRQLAENISMAVKHLISVTKDGWESIGGISIKSTMGPSLRVF
jgi:large subunit ribosomal protein L10Ae